MKKLLFVLLFSSIAIYSQREKSTAMGKGSLEELKMTVYEKDSTASAVVLFEHANRYPDKLNDEIPRTDYYFRVKIFDKSSFDLANISIYLRKNETLKDLKAVTYNITDIGTIDKKRLETKDVFTTDSENWTAKKFTLPNLKEGSVIEYSYSILSRSLGIDDWYFQSEIPKIKSLFSASILGNYKYNIRLIGFKKLDEKDIKVDKECVYVNSIGYGSCAVYTYGMHDVPAFKEEDYMLSKKNYLSRISFDLKSRTSYSGEIKDFTTTWEKADKSLKNVFFNNQTSKKSFFRKKLPEDILNTKNHLERAKKVFSFIQNHYTWNGDYWRNSDAKVKKAFDEKTGDVGEINLSLFNSLKAANIDVNLVVLSTRNNGISTKLYPIIFDYNYVIVKITIDKKSYFLDATSNFLPFGQVPVRCLNGEARVLDFKKGSYWQKLTPRIKTSVYRSVRLNLSSDGELEGSLMIKRTGYFAATQREKLYNTNEEKYLEDFETENLDTEVKTYTVKEKEDFDKPIQEIFKIKIFGDNENADKIRINPIFFGKTKENPFKLKERQYPVDFAFSRKINYSINLTIPDNYTVTELPKKAGISLPNKAGIYLYGAIQKGNIVNVYVRYALNKRVYSSEEYEGLKEFFKRILIAEKSYIIIEKNK